MLLNIGFLAESHPHDPQPSGDARSPIAVHASHGHLSSSTAYMYLAAHRGSPINRPHMHQAVESAHATAPSTRARLTGPAEQQMLLIHLEEQTRLTGPAEQQLLPLLVLSVLALPEHRSLPRHLRLPALTQGCVLVGCGKQAGQPAAQVRQWAGKKASVGGVRSSSSSSVEL